MTEYDTDYFYKRIIENFDREYYEQDAKRICATKGWPEERWEEIAEFFEELQIERTQIQALEHILNAKFISDMDDALS